MNKELLKDNNLIYCIHKETKEVRYFKLDWGNTYHNGAGWIGALTLGEERRLLGICQGDNRELIDPTDWDFIPRSILKIFQLWNIGEDLETNKYLQASNELMKVLIRELEK